MKEQHVQRHGGFQQYNRFQNPGLDSQIHKLMASPYFYLLDFSKLKAHLRSILCGLEVLQAASLP